MHATRMLIERLDAWLAKNRPGYYASLKPGLTPEQLAAWERETMDRYHAQLGLAPADWLAHLPQSFRELYLWRNGQADDSEGFWYELTLLPLEQVLTWQPVPGCLTFLLSYRRRMLALDLFGAVRTKEDISLRGQVITADADEVTGRIEAASFDQWLELLVTSLEAGHWSVEPDEDVATRTFGPEWTDWKAHVERHAQGFPFDTDEDIDLRSQWV